jgi:hypothetical protein
MPTGCDSVATAAVHFSPFHMLHESIRLLYVKFSGGVLNFLSSGGTRLQTLMQWPKLTPSPETARVNNKANGLKNVAHTGTRWQSLELRC